MKLTSKHFEPKYKLDIRSAVSYEPSCFFGENKWEYYHIDTDVLLSNGEPLQRDHVWDIHQKRSLIISILKGLEIPNFLVVIYKDDITNGGGIRDTYFKIIDGKQRITTIKEFIEGKFGLLVNDIEYFFNDLEKMTQFKITNCNLKFNVIYEYPDTRLSDEQLISAFEYVNFAGTPQDIKHFEKLKTYLK